MVEAKAWLYALRGTPWVTVERQQINVEGIAETPLYGPEALAERDALIAALREAETALRDYACYGPEAPCARPKHQCQFMECGGAASKALIAVLAALESKS